MEGVGRRIVELRKRLGLMQKELARRVRLTHAHLSAGGRTHVLSCGGVAPRLQGRGRSPLSSP